jgi:hypothetical protein
LSKSRGFKERLLRLIGVYPVRCEECSERFFDSVWRMTEWMYSRCPRCYRMDLGTWELKYYQPPTTQMMAINLGAKRRRCEACRCNFVSFRLLKEKSTFRRRKGSEEPFEAEPESNSSAA